MGIIKSKIRSKKPISFEIDEGITITSTGATNINIPFLVNHVDFFPSSFKLDVHKNVIYIDPLIVDEEVPADYILITHPHQDHFSKNDIRKLLKRETKVICPKSVFKKLSKELEGYTIIEIKPGDKMDFGNLTIESIEAYNIKSGFWVPHSKSALYVGYIINSGKVRIYHAGDTDYTPEMMKLKNINLALTPIDGGKLSMTTEKAAEFINNLNPQFAVPMHYMIGTDEVEKFKELVNRNTRIIVMDGLK
ncbi:MBL fold metallo-hydrolase [Anaerosacchariphilus polymeriproducens]|uniref:MBL fold metallo-hydrolase n=1 Tax=Anaerosacchariphilus polymeriproducens TaxID=1812858 RepID=UPI001390028C|nr:MBL fold metallo-hydrolase [Anaerosacchariphilus polymeriproducens]